MGSNGYAVSYKVRRNEPRLTAIEAEAQSFDDWGAADAVLVGSLIYPSDGSYSALFLSMDGRTGLPLDAEEMWKAWTMLAKRLADDDSLSDDKRQLAQSVFDVVQSAIKETMNG